MDLKDWWIWWNMENSIHPNIKFIKPWNHEIRGLDGLMDPEKISFRFHQLLIDTFCEIHKIEALKTDDPHFVIKTTKHPWFHS